MDLRFTPEQQAFRAEVREWLHAHVPRERLASYDTREGFEQHRAWEATLAEAGYSALNWPVALGGRGALPMRHRSSDQHPVTIGHRTQVGRRHHRVAADDGQALDGELLVGRVGVDAGADGGAAQVDLGEQ